MKPNKADNAPEVIIRRVTWVGLGVNLFLSAVKFIAGWMGSSQALLADAVHSLSDSITDIAVIVGSYFWSEPPDRCHPHGHRRIETLVTLAIGVMILSAGIGIGWHAIQTIHEQGSTRPGWLALAASALSLVIKEILFRWTDTAGKKIKSPALAANAWHHRLDAVSSIPVFLAVGGTLLFPSLRFLDHIGALVVAVFILQASFKILWPGIEELMEKGASRQALVEIERLVTEEPEVIQIHQVRTRYLGSRLRLDFHLVVDGGLTIKQGHDIAERVKQKLLREISDLEDAIVHIEPHDQAL
ncbi:MAG: cation transporter [Desulfobacteraceae bacterium]|nr:MAG: cation transporter [Desulfobacteraceae bacterium]